MQATKPPPLQLYCNRCNFQQRIGGNCRRGWLKPDGSLKPEAERIRCCPEYRIIVRRGWKAGPKGYGVPKLTKQQFADALRVKTPARWLQFATPQLRLPKFYSYFAVFDYECMFLVMFTHLYEEAHAYCLSDGASFHPDDIDRNALILFCFNTMEELYSKTRSVIDLWQDWTPNYKAR